MRDGSVDMAVHSAKDVPTSLDKEFTIAAVPERVDPRDALVSRYGVELSLLRMGARVGTGSLRRAAQLRYVREDLQIVPMRGNVDTRLGKVMGDTDDAPDAVVLAMAGLIRTGLTKEHADCIRPLEDMIPAAGQGALVIETLAANEAVTRLLEPLNHRPSHEALLAERAVLGGLRADCHSCVAVHIRQNGSLWSALAMAARPGGQELIQVDLTAASPAAAGQDLLESLLEKGADTLISG
jgi:hydroxymethylbilane synthase